MSDEQIATEHDPAEWFAEHYHGAAQEVIDFIEGDGIHSWQGKGDRGCRKR